MGRGMREERKGKEGKGGGRGVAMGRQKGEAGDGRGRKKRSRKKRLRIKILLMQILLLVSHRLCWVDGRDEIAWTNQYCDADGEGCNIDEGEEKP